nr:50S ribosomal protein L11 methyltransferase [Phytohabitans houttuyneae]
MRLFLAEDAIILWARLEATAGRPLRAPYWASAWAGGQALARYILDNPASVAGRTVLDIASGSGLVAIAAALAGAKAVTANDIDPYAIAAIAANARINGVTISPAPGDMLDGDGDGAEVVLAGDALYDGPIAQRVVPFLTRAVERGAHVLLGDPDRRHLPESQLRRVATYHTPVAGPPEDAQIRRADVFAVQATTAEQA